jgi:hypothetical protein
MQEGINSLECQEKFRGQGRGSWLLFRECLPSGLNESRVKSQDRRDRKFLAV